MFLNILKLIAIVLYIYDFNTTRGDTGMLRVFQGRDAKPGEVSYAAALTVKSGEGIESETYKDFCSGSIVTPIWTLTAGHCIDIVEALRLSIEKRNINLERPKLVIRHTIYSDNKQYEHASSQIIGTQRYPSYKLISKGNPVSVFNDIGLVKTDKTRFNSVLGKFSSVDYKTLYGHKMLVTGFGLMYSDAGVHTAIFLNKSLQVYEAILIKCSRNRDMIRPLVCLSWDCNTPATSCHGDSGAPVIHPSGIIGVLTSGENKNCNKIGKSIHAGTVTPVSPFLNWIVKTTSLVAGAD